MKNFLILFLLSGFILSCSSDKNTPEENPIYNPEYGIWQERENPPVEFELVQTFGSEDATSKELIGGITAMFTDNNQNLYVLDDRLSKLISFDKNGKVRWATGSKGRGPGDFENAWNMIWDGKLTIYISNIARSRIDLFNLNGEFLKTLSVNNEKLKGVNIHGFMENKMVVSRSISGSFAKEFFFINPDNPDSISSSFIVDLTGELNIPQGMSWFSNVSILEDQMVVAGISEYSYSFYNIDSTKTKKLTRDFDKIMRAGFFQNDNGRAIGSMGGLNPILKAGNEFYIATAAWPTNIDDPDQYMKDMNSGKNIRAEFRNTTDIYDQNFQLLYSIESDEFINQELGLISHSDSEGFVYSINFSPYPHVKKFKLSKAEY
ncbi:hypothetical protein A8B79_10525 [Balneola sp. EhC07]|uniref:6-bladed beta-propeller n=1 Tax=Balneola sp. EhC07 TaxID=1849360 RepID=UPI0007F46277|nr:6-bladed beta-propeller [Balneola sp. EhC07]OAN60373.1 hypothetical protein A8B79_10525 [Balneola sp. EhC07]